MTLPSISFSGIATPFDVNEVIDQLMAVERIPLQQLQARRATYEAKDTAWVSINTRLSALRSSLNDLDGGLDGFLTASTSSEAVTASVTGASAPGSISFTVDQLAAAHVLISSGTFASGDELTGAGEFTLDLGDGEPLTVPTDETTTYSQLAASITALDAGVTATVLQTGDDQFQLLLASQTMGDEAAFTASSTLAGLGSFSAIQTGADAQISIGSLTIERNSNTVSDLLPGVTINLVATTEAPVSVTASRDPVAAADAVEALVTELNATLEELNTATRYNVDTESGGALVGDSTARGIVSDLRNAVSGAIGGTEGTLIPAAVGISITRTGTFIFDRAAFEGVLAGDFASVEALMSDEVFTRLDEALDAAEGVDGSVARARDRWQASMEDLDGQIERWEDRLDSREGRLIRQFAALDSTLAALSSQSNWLAAQLASFSGQQG
jgi:flagellar hook-associated protein 2